MAEWNKSTSFPNNDIDYDDSHPKTQSPPHLPPLPSRSKPPQSTTPSENNNPPLQSSGTYVVQVPKEQIFRVPPSENARLAEEYRRKMQNKQRKCPHSLRFLLCSLSILLSFIFILGLAIGIFYLVVRPGIPSFTLESLAKAREGFQFHMVVRSVNPCFKMGYCYEAGGNVALLHKGKEIAVGKTPGYCQGFMSSSLFKLKVEGGSLHATNNLDSLVLWIQYPVRLKVGGVRVMSRSLDITCDFRVRGLGTMKRTHNVSQGCSAKMRLI